MYARTSSLALRSFSRLFLRPVNTGGSHRVCGVTSSWFARPSNFSTCSRLLCAAETSVGQENLETDEKKTLFVGALGLWATEDVLRDHFNKFGEIDSLSIVRTNVTKRPRFAYLTFKDEDAVEKILQQSHELRGNELLVQEQRPTFSDPGRTCFVQLRKISPEISKEDVVEHFFKYGEVVAVDWPVDPSSNVRRDYCFVQFSSEEDAEAAALKDSQVLGTCKQSVAVRKSRSIMNYDSTDSIMLYPPEDTTVESLFEYYSKFGRIRSISGRFCFVDASLSAKPVFWIYFEDAGSVLEAVKQTNLIDGQVVPTLRSKPQFQPTTFPSERKVFVDGLPPHLKEIFLLKYFDEFGKVQSCNLIKDPGTGLQMNWCVVTFRFPEGVDKLMAKEQHQIADKYVRIRRLGWRQVPLNP